jgi:hypothetical protein
VPSSIGLPALVDGLGKHYGPPPPPITIDPFEQILLVPTTGKARGIR